MNTEYLIIGNSAAGVGCIEGIRQNDARGRITVLSREKTFNYSKPLIHHYLSGAMDEKDLQFRSRDFYTKNRTILLTGTRAVKIDGRGRRVFLDSGKTICFRKLLICTGGRPILPDIRSTGKGGPLYFTFSSLEETARIKEHLHNNNIRNAVVLGGGLIGLKCAQGLLERGIKVTIVELSGRMLANTLDDESSSILEKLLLENGCDVRKHDTVVSVSRSRKEGYTLVLKSGRRIRTGMLIVAVGVRPVIDITEGSGIKTDSGIIVDTRMQTSLPGVYAAGDCAQTKDVLTGTGSVIAIWPAASEQGRIAGINMSGGRKEYAGALMMNSLEICGLPSISMGVTDPGEIEGIKILKRGGQGGTVYRKIVLKQDRIIGAIFMGKIDRAGIFSGLIRKGIDTSSFQGNLLNDDFGLLLLPAEYRKHMVRGDGIEV